MEKKVLPVLLIVVLFTMLFSTYAWFSSAVNTRATAVVDSGTATGITLATNATGGGNSFTAGDINARPYEGQKAFKEDGTAYRSDEADFAYAINANLEYLFKASGDARLNITLKQATVQLGENYNLTPAVTLEQIFNIPTVLPIENTTIENYIFTDINNVPDNIKCGCIVDETDSNKVLQVFMKDEYALKFFEFDYWESDNTSNAGNGIERTDANYVSALGGGIFGEYGVDVSKVGITNYMRIYVGFYGKDNNTGVYNQPFLFSDLKYQNSSFKFYFLARVENA